MNYRLRYEGSLVSLVICAVLFFPIALVLLLTNWSAEGSGQRTSCRYEGSTFWLGFWTLCFFPFAIFLIIHNGLTISHYQAGAQQAA